MQQIKDLLNRAKISLEWFNKNTDRKPGVQLQDEHDHYIEGVNAINEALERFPSLVVEQPKVDRGHLYALKIIAASAQPDTEIGLINFFITAKTLAANALADTSPVKPVAGSHWVKGEYERLYMQVKAGIRTVCFIDYRFFGIDMEPCRDICTAKYFPEYIELSSRGHAYLTVWNYLSIDVFIRICEASNVEWLEEIQSTPIGSQDFENALESELIKLENKGQHDQNGIVGFYEGASWAHSLNK